MKLLLLVGLLSTLPPALRDEPPPEPLDCPLCAGNGVTHYRTMLQLEGIFSGIVFRALP